MGRAVREAMGAAGGCDGVGGNGECGCEGEQC